MCNLGHRTLGLFIVFSQLCFSQIEGSGDNNWKILIFIGILSQGKCTLKHLPMSHSAMCLLPCPLPELPWGERLRHHCWVLVLRANLRFLLYGCHLGQSGKDQEVRGRDLFCPQLLISLQENVLELGCQDVSAKGSWKKQSQVLILPNAQ